MDLLKTKDIIIGGGKLSIPFELALNKKKTVLKCKELLRFVPGRRAVFSGYWNGKKIVAKFFFKPFRYKSHVKKELRGNDVLHQAQLPTAEIIHSEFCKKIKAHLLIFEFIDSSIHLGKIFKSDSHLKSGKKYLSAMIRFIGRMHEKGIIHTDLHPNNFLLKDDIIYAIDGAAVKRISDTPLETDRSLKNLSIILYQLDRTSNDLFYDLVDVYIKTRNLKDRATITVTLEKFITKSQKQMTGKYLKKIYRNSTDIVCRKTYSSFMLCRRSYFTPAMASFLKNPDAAFYDPEKKILKAGNSSTVVRYHIDGVELVIKRYNMKNRRHALRRAFKRTRADISWRSAHLLVQNRINTSRPIAIMEKRFGPFRNKAFFLCEYVKGKDVLEYFQEANAGDMSRTAQSVISIFSKLKSLMISHGDMKATNIIIQDGEPFLIDLDSMTRHRLKTRFLHAHKKDINRFLKNWMNDPEILKNFKKINP